MTDLKVIFNTILDYDTLNKNIHLFVDPAWDRKRETSNKGCVLVEIGGNLKGRSEKK